MDRRAALALLAAVPLAGCGYRLRQAPRFAFERVRIAGNETTPVAAELRRGGIEVNDSGGKPLAQWLHGFYASHAKPFPMRMETLLKLSGSESESPRSAQQTLCKALDAVSEASAANGEIFGYEVHGDLVNVEKRPSGTQRRHLAKARR